MIVKEINGVERGFRFGTYTFKIISEISDLKTIESLFAALKDEPLKFLSVFYFACAKHYAISKKQEVDFNESDVCDWLDEIGFQESQIMLTELLNSYTLKNMKAPMTGQAAQQ